MLFYQIVLCVGACQGASSTPTFTFFRSTVSPGPIWSPGPQSFGPLRGFVDDSTRANQMEPGPREMWMIHTGMTQREGRGMSANYTKSPCNA